MKIAPPLCIQKSLTTETFTLTHTHPHTHTPTHHHPHRRDGHTLHPVDSASGCSAPTGLPGQGRAA